MGQRTLLSVIRVYFRLVSWSKRITTVKLTNGKKEEEEH